MSSRSRAQLPLTTKAFSSASGIFLPTQYNFPQLLIGQDAPFWDVYDQFASLLFPEPNEEGEDEDDESILVSFTSRLNNPFVFTPAEEINFLFLYHLLRCGEYNPTPSIDPDDPEATPVPYVISPTTINNNILRGVLSLAMDDSITIHTITLPHIAEIFGFQLDEEYKLATGIYGYQDHPEKALANEILNICKNASLILKKQGYDDFATYFNDIIRTIKAKSTTRTSTRGDIDPQKKQQKQPQYDLPTTSFNTLIQIIITDFPDFNDETTLQPPRHAKSSFTRSVDGVIPEGDFLLLAEVQSLVYDLYWKFSSGYENYIITLRTLIDISKTNMKSNPINKDDQERMDNIMEQLQMGYDEWLADREQDDDGHGDDDNNDPGKKQHPWKLFEIDWSPIITTIPLQAEETSGMTSFSLEQKDNIPKSPEHQLPITTTTSTNHQENQGVVTEQESRDGGIITFDLTPGAENKINLEKLPTTLTTPTTPTTTATLTTTSTTLNPHSCFTPIITHSVVRLFSEIADYDYEDLLENDGDLAKNVANKWSKQGKIIVTEDSVISLSYISSFIFSSVLMSITLHNDFLHRDDQIISFDDKIDLICNAYGIKKVHVTQDDLKSSTTTSNNNNNTNNVTIFDAILFYLQLFALQSPDLPLPTRGTLMIKIQQWIEQVPHLYPLICKLFFTSPPPQLELLGLTPHPLTPQIIKNATPTPLINTTLLYPLFQFWCNREISQMDQEEDGE